MMFVTRWWWVRHAPVVNPTGRIYGAGDIACDCSDQASFAALARALPAEATWVVTPLRRTVLTATTILAARGEEFPEMVVEPAFAEQDFGEWQGLSHRELDAQRPAAAHRFWLAPAEERPPGGESFTDVVARVAAGIERFSADQLGGDVVVVAHGGPIRAAVGLALGLAPERALQFRIDTLSVTRLDRIAQPGKPPVWRVSGVNWPARGFGGKGLPAASPD